MATATISRPSHFTEQERDQLLADVNAFCEELRPHEELCYVSHKFNDQVVPLAKKYNLLGMPVPKEYGGRGSDTLTYVKALMRIGQEGTGVRTFFSGHTSIGEYPILTWGNEDQKNRYLSAAVNGEITLCFGLTEPEAGSNPLEMQTTYERKGDKYILNGDKYLISNAGIANSVVTFAYPAKDGQRIEGGRISAFIVDLEGETVQIESLNDKMGMFTSNTGMFSLEDHEVPLENMLGDEGDGFRIAMGTLVSGRLSVAAGCLGVIEDCLIESLRYARERFQHGKEIGKHQLVQDHIAQIEMDRIASECLLFRAAEAKDLANANPDDPARQRQAELLAAQSKFYATNAAWDAADRAVQVWGGKGWSTIYRPGRHLMDVRVCRIYEGTDEILKLKIASALLGKEFQAYK
ncbi:MAG: acyl-CoA dehydrogenase family protein [Gemmataceae bacterium]